MMWIVDADTLIDAIKDMSILIDGYIEKSDDYIRTVKCSECEYLKVHNTEALYAFCPKFGIEFYPFENDTRKHGCSWGKPKGKTLVVADRKTEPTISKMEQVDKDINVRSKDEPRKEQNFCGKCRYLYRDFKYGLSCYRLMDNEPCKYEERKDEPQTDCAWK